MVLYHLITENGKGKNYRQWKGKIGDIFFLLQCALSPGNFSIKPGAQRFQAETPRLRVKPGELETLDMQT